MTTAQFQFLRMLVFQTRLLFSRGVLMLLMFFEDRKRLVKYRISNTTSIVIHFFPLRHYSFFCPKKNGDFFVKVKSLESQ